MATCITRRILLDVARAGSQLALYFRQGDNAVYALVARMCEKSTPVTLEDGMTAALRMQKPDGKIVFGQAVVRDGGVTAYFPTAAFSASGIAAGEIDVYGESGAVLYSPRFDCVIEPVVVADGEIEASSDFSALTTAITELTAMKNGYQDEITQAQETETAMKAAAGNVTLLAHKWNNVDVTVKTLEPEQPGSGSAIVKADGVALNLNLPRGHNGVTTELQSGMYGMYVNDQGHLILALNDGEATPPLSIVNGCLIYTIEA